MTSRLSHKNNESSPTLSHNNILSFSSSCVPVLQLYLGNGEPRIDGCWAEQGHHCRSWAHLEKGHLRTCVVYTRSYKDGYIELKRAPDGADKSVELE